MRSLEPVLSQGLLEDKFYLADQVLYGSSRLGVKTYLPSQYQYHWNHEQTLAQNQARWDSSTAAYRMPWYSDAVQSLMHYNAPGPYNVAQSEPFWSSRIIGQKRYELTNHLGNVLGVVSDKVTEVAAPGSGKDERASLKAAYDYYPFGMVMPSRMLEDHSINCIPVSRTRYVREVVKQNQFSAGGVQSITGRAVAIGGSKLDQMDDSRLEVVRGEGLDEAFPIEVAMPVGMLLGSDEVGVRLTTLVEGQGELVAQLRWYPGGWSSESGPVGDAYEVLNEAMVPDNGPLTVEAGNEDAPLPVQMRSNGGLALVLRSVNSGSGRLVAAEVAYETVIRAVQTYVVLSCDTDGVWGGGYQYGFNGQRKTDEISGMGNHNTATFWEYDTRLGRRWNLDPRPQVRISDYAAMGNNPIANSDPKGDVFKVQTKQAGSTPTASCVPRGRVTDPANQSQAQRDVRGVAGKYADIISFGEDGTVSLDISQIGKNIEDPVARSVEVARAMADPGLAVISDLVTSEKSFYFGNEKTYSFGYSEDQGKTWDLAEWTIMDVIPGKVIDPVSTKSGANFFSKFAQNLNGQPSAKGVLDERMFRALDYDGAVYMPNAEYRNIRDGVTYIVPRASAVYHELRENYLRVSGIEPYYESAHDRSSKDEGNHYGNKNPGEINEVQFR
ncbi:MAG: hypothetical protein EOP52_13960 [Sphingobacteriales bacterium]|nr:MAG: hypothetical protein EOP52_13960 [Sphingobacteriales bacterium]